MKLVSAVERMASMDRSEVILLESQCLHQRSKLSDCQLCVEVCPVGALQPGAPPSLDVDKCVSCYACLPVCPVGSLQAHDAVASLLDCSIRLGNSQIELLCDKHVHSKVGVSEGLTGLRLKGCLAGLGAGAYTILYSLGVERLFLRVDECSNCGLRDLLPRILDQAAWANHFLSSWSARDLILCLNDLTDPEERPLWDADNPPMSRRDLFRIAGKQSQISLARAMNPEVDKKRGPGRDQLRINQAVNHISDAAHDGKVSLGDMNYAIADVDENCTACGACAQICPTEALQFKQDEKKEHYSLSFSPRECVGCGLCEQVCLTKAIQLDHSPDYAQVFGQDANIALTAGRLKECDRCNALIAVRAHKKLCPLCEFRKDNPLGSKMPPGFPFKKEGRMSDDN